MKLSFLFRCALSSSAIYIAIKLSVFFTHSQFTGIGIYSGLISLALLGIPLFIGIKHRRDSELGGYIYLRQIMITGVVISLMSSLIISIYTYVHYKFIDKDSIAYWIEEAKQLGANEKKSELEIQQAIQMLTEFYSPFKQATVALTGVLGTGAVMSFMFAAFLIKRPPASEN